MHCRQKEVNTFFVIVDKKYKPAFYKKNRQYDGYQQSSSSSTSVTTAEQNRYLGKTLLMEMENKRNSDQQQHRGQLYSPSPARKAADSSLSCHKGSDTTSGMPPHSLVACLSSAISVSFKLDATL
jgi:hypothetical protein